MTGGLRPWNMTIASGTQASGGIGRSSSNTGKDVFLECLRPAEEQPERHAERGGEDEGDATRAQMLTQMCW